MDNENKVENANNYNKIFKFLSDFPFNKKIAIIIIIIKILPLVVITHDWKIDKNSGISYYIRKLTFSEIINNINNIEFFYIILYTCFVLIIFNYIIFIKSICFNKTILYPLFLKKLNLILYLCNPYLYSIFTEIVFNNDLKNKISNDTYIISIIVIFICISYLIQLDIILSSIILEEAMFIGNKSIFINEIGRIDLICCFFSLLQIIVQIEFNIKEKNCIILKIAIRSITAIIIFIYFFEHSFYFYRINYDYIYRFIVYICFSSIIMEFFVLNEYYNNKKFIFQEDKALLVIKICLEIFCSLLINYIYFHFEFKIIQRDFANFNSNIFSTYNNNIIKVFNLIYFMDKPNELKKILMNLNSSLKTRVHVPICNKENIKCFFCHIYNYSKFEIEIKNCIFKMKNKLIKKINLKNECPILYQYLSNSFENVKFMNINYSQKFYTALLILVTFYFSFKKEYFKCLYIIETVKYNPSIKNNFLQSLQLNIIKTRILNYYIEKKKAKLENYVGITKEEEDEIKLVYNFTNNFDSVNKIIKIEKSIKSVLKNFQSIMKIFNDEDISFNNFSLLIKNFSNNYNFSLNKLKNLFKGLKCTIFYPLKKIAVPFEFLLSEIPKDIIKPMNNFFSNQISIIEDNKEVYILTINVQFQNNHFKFPIKYVSDELIKKLNYSKNELNSIYFTDLFPKAFSKAYIYIFSNTLENGTEFLKIKKLCLQDKFQYISLFDFKGVAITNQKGIQLYFQLLNTIEEKLLEKHSIFNNMNYNNNIAGTCFLFTNKYGRIIHISRGFEDYFFINTIILLQYKIYVFDLFKIGKLKKKGNIEIGLNEILKNINEIFNKEIGQISEDEFSKIITKLRTFEETLKTIKFSFIVTGNFEQRKFKVKHNKEKILYIFCIFIKLKETQNFIQENNILFLENLINSNAQIISSNSHRDITVDNSIITNLEDIALKPQIFDKESRFWFLLKKVKNINNMFIILLKKYFNIIICSNNNNIGKNDTIEDEKTIKDKEEKEILNYNEMSKKHLKESFMVKIKKYSFMEQYFPSLISLLFYILLIIMFIKKIQEIIYLKEYVYSFGVGNMYVQIVNQMVLKVLQMQYSANKIQKEIINGTYNNSWEYNNEQLSLRIQEYLIYVKKYTTFLTDNHNGRKYILPLLKKKGNYTIPLINGSKKIEVYNVFHNYVHIILNEVTINGKIPIIYNNSNYFFNDTMINNFPSFSRLEYYDKALSYVEFLENFSLYFTFIASEAQTIFYSVIIYGEISLQKKLSFVLLIIAFTFSIFEIIEFFIFFKKTLILFSNYFLGYIRIRFFNNYINSKIDILLDYIDNYTKSNKINIKMDEIEIIQNNTEEFILKNIINDQYEKFKSIKVQPFKVKNIIHYDTTYNLQKDIIKNRNELFELSKNYTESKILNSPRIFNILKKQSSYSLSMKNNILVSSNIKLKDLSRSSITNLNKIEKKSNFGPAKGNRESSSSTNINKSTTSINISPTFTNVSNLSISKSNVNLINSSVRSNFTHKSSLKLLNEDNKSNLSQSKSISKNQLIKNDKDYEIQKKYLSTGKTLLNKPNLYFNFLFFLFIMILVSIGIAVIQIILSINFINNTKSMIQMQYNIFLFLKYNIQIVIYYGLIVLKNEPLVFYYQANEYTRDCEPIDKEMKANYAHSIFVESQTCYQTLKNILGKIPSGKINTNLIELSKIHNKFYSNEFCVTYSEFIIEHKNDNEIKELRYLTNVTYENLYSECTNIGNGINSKGYNIAIDIIHQSLKSYYDDFINDNNRNEESNLKRINDELFLASLIENVEITKKLSIIYLIVFNKDFDKFRNTVIFIETILFIIQIIIMLVITISYIINLKRFEREIEKVNFFNKCLINSILYK